MVKGGEIEPDFLTCLQTTGIPQTDLVGSLRFWEPAQGVSQSLASLFQSEHMFPWIYQLGFWLQCYLNTD